MELAIAFVTRLGTELQRIKYGLVITAILESWNILTQKLGPAVLSAIESAWSAASTWSKETWNVIKNWGIDAWSATTEWTVDAWNATKNWTAETWNATKNWTAETWNSTKNWTADMWNKTTTAVGNAMANIGSFFSGITLPDIKWPWQ
ncbi:MAG: hypothetical protein HC916_06225 [Coleofasciculaceae cyanobacterium SM2_1_6]|nr:hypothetical protein [Coleofasciculaceae cyanobacterium SM2_1_6]